MNNNREQLVPSDNLSDFYKQKISVGLTNIYCDWLELDNNKSILLRINLLLEKIFHQIKSRLKKFEFEDHINKYNEINKELHKLIPFSKTYIEDKGAGKRIKKVRLTKEYSTYKALLIKKEELLWDSLDSLGLIGQVEVKAQRLR